MKDGHRQHWVAVKVPGKARLWEVFLIIYHRTNWYQENTLAFLNSWWPVCLLRRKKLSLNAIAFASMYKSAAWRTEYFKSWYNKTAAESHKKKSTEKQRDENRLDIWYPVQGWESKSQLLSHSQHPYATQSPIFLIPPISVRERLRIAESLDSWCYSDVIGEKKKKT